ncbi:unnamed protein product [Sphagnum balticum]|jgi:hypothetical protein
MVYNKSDSDGTDDEDLPPTHLGRMTRKGRPSGNGKSGGTAASLEQQIRNLELDAYTAVLRAFGAQSEVITWTKERLMSDLRKELRVADEQHRELLGRVASDDTLRQIREWRQLGEGTGLPILSHDPAPSPAVSQSRKKQKTGHSVQTLPPPPPPPLLKQAPITGTALSSPAPGTGGGPRGKKTRSKGSVGPPVATLKPAPPMGRGSNAGRGNAPWSNHIGAGPSDMHTDPWVGRRVMTRWPEDNTFYEAVVTDYDRVKHLHLLVYDMSTPQETWEWIDLKGMDKKDVKWIEGPPVLLDGKAAPTTPASSVGRGAGRGLKRGGKVSAGAGRAKGGQRGRPAGLHEKMAPFSSGHPARPGRGGPGGEAQTNGSDWKTGRAVAIQIPDLAAFVKEVDELEQEEDLEKLESVRLKAKEHEEMLHRALVEVGESSDEAGSDDGRHHQAAFSLTHSIDQEKEHHSRQDSGERHNESDEEEDTAGDQREVSEGDHGVHESGGAASDAEVENAEEDGEGDDDR